MSTTKQPEAWLRGPLPGIDPALMPAAHALVQAREDIAAAAAELVAAATAAIDRALEQLRRTPPATLAEARPVGRAALPATVLGLLVHAAEHASRHTGQLITTLKIARGQRTASPA
jgi:uncharacterized damage-inducible protein DinB